MERFIYINGAFFDRMSNTPEEIARSLKATILKVVPFDHSICGASEKVYLTR